MSIELARDVIGRRILLFGQALKAAPDSGSRDTPDWAQVSPGEIKAMMERVRRLPSGGWYAVDASNRIAESPRFYWVDGRELVAWRSDGSLHVGPNACPHMGAPLSAGKLYAGRLVCPWHGLGLDGQHPHGQWQPIESHDDGVLIWVRLPGSEPTTNQPILSPRPRSSLSGVLRMVARCDPDDIIANRLDPWHGAWFHPHSFARLRVLSLQEDVRTVRVAFRVAGPF